MGNGALATTEQKAGGIMDMSGSTVEMHHNLEEMKAKIDLVQQYIKEVMIPDIDYGKIPNTDKNTLFQPGADKLSFLYGYSRNIVSKEENKDFNTGHYDVTVRVQMRHKTSNIIVGDGEGSCSTRESKYCYRWVYDNDVPSGIDKSTLISQTFKTKKKEGEEQRSFTKYRMDNRDLFDTWNTILKMAIKRAYVAAVLASTGLGGMFSQDEDDFEAWAGGEDNNDRKDRLGKERLEKERRTPKSSDEKSTFNPSASGGMITIAQKNKIQYDAEKKNVKAADIDAIVKSTKGKAIDELTKAEASAVIDWFGKVSKDDLQDLIIDLAMDGGGEK